MNHIQERLFEEEMKESFLDYARYVITDRALPDVRDGLKPVQRVILYAMAELGLKPSKPHKKSARIVGDVIGKYHPHGDASVYDALVRMAQDFRMRYPLVDGHGNFGSIDGDPPAAMRYTEARLSPYGMLMLEELEKTVDFEDNFDGSLKKPVVLPGRIPHLLLNGVSGIAVGMSTTFVPHNAREIFDALVALLTQPETDLSKIIKGPDFPTGNVFINPVEWKKILKTGAGKVTIQASVTEEKTKDTTSLVFTDIPYGVKKNKVMEKIVQLAGTEDGIADIRDESGRDGIRLVIEVKKGHAPKTVLFSLYHKTPLQTTINIQNHALVNGKPQILNVKTMLQMFTDYRREMVERQLNYDLGKEESHCHLLEGLVKALENIQKAIDILKGSRKRETAKEKLKSTFGLTDLQAEAILQMRLSKLTGMEKKAVLEEWKLSKEIVKTIHQQLSHLNDVLIAEWKALRDQIGDPRRTEIAKPAKRKPKKGTSALVK